MNNICCIFNLGPLYRKAIFSLMDKELQCDFYLGDRAATPMKTMDYNSLSGFKGIVKYKVYGLFYRLAGSHKATFNPKYKQYIVTGDSFCFSIWFLLLWARLTGKRVILWCHGWHTECSKITHILLKIFYALAHHILLYGDYSRNFMIKKGISSDKLTCIYNSLDYDKQILVRHSLQENNIYQDHFGNKYPVLLYIGRIQKRKRIDMILEAMAYLKSQGIHLNFVCIGDPTEDINLKELIQNSKLEDRVWLYGPLYDEQKKGELIYNANICVSPGNVGLTAMDALNFGLPIITNDNFSTQMPEFEAIENGKTGLFFHYNNVIDLAEKIKDWLNYEEKIGRNSIRKSCYKMIDGRYNPHYQISVFKQILDLKN